MNDEIFIKESENFKHTRDFINFNIPPDIKNQEKEVYKFYDNDKDSNQPTKFDSNFSNSNNTNEFPNQINQMSKNNNDHNNCNNKENKERPKSPKIENINNPNNTDKNKILLKFNNTCQNQNLFLINNNNNNNNNKKNKKNRRKYDPDEIRIRIKNKLHKFSINYLNYLIRKENQNNQKVKFRKIEYKKVFGGNKEQNKKFLQKKFKEFIEENNITSKFTTKNLELNKKHLKKFDLNDKLCNDNLNETKVSNFLNMTMEFIFINYFLNKKHEKDYYLNQKQKKDKIIFFDDFIEQLKNKKEDENYIEKVKQIAKDYIKFYNNYNEKDESFLSKKRNLFCVNVGK